MITDHKRMVALFEFEGVPPSEKVARSYLGNEANESP